MTPLRLIETRHPDKEAAESFGHLVGIEDKAEELLRTLELLLCPARAHEWARRHHGGEIGLLRRQIGQAPLVLLTGDVGCGKTALATSIGTPFAHRLDDTVLVLETPSDVRGGGHVGELSLRLTAAFDQARGKMRDHRFGLLIIDEGDDLATSRAQMQAHHEDRAGVNVLIKEVGKLASAPIRLAVILITNRLRALDAAVVRRAALHLEFARPNGEARRRLLSSLLGDLGISGAQIDELVAASDTSPPMTYSDLVNRLAVPTVSEAIALDVPVTFELLLAQLRQLRPSPNLEDAAADRTGP